MWLIQVLLGVLILEIFYTGYIFAKTADKIITLLESIDAEVGQGQRSSL
jgi:hypothetical protein